MTAQVRSQFNILPGLLTVLFITSCTVFPNPDTPTASSEVNKLETLIFTNAETKQRMLKLDRCINDLSDSGWTIIPYEETGGNYYKARWCVGTGVGYPGYPCGLSAATAYDRDQYVIQLYTSFYPSEFPDVSGLGMIVEQVPEAEGWGVHLFYEEDILRYSGYSLIFNLYTEPTGEPQSRLYIGSASEYRVHETRIHPDYPPNSSTLDEFPLLIASSESLRDHWLARDEALRQKVVQVINSGEVTTCDYGPDEGDGTEPVCYPRPLSTTETEEALIAAEQYFTERRNLLIQNYQEMYDVLLSAFPFDRCWD